MEKSRKEKPVSSYFTLRERLMMFFRLIPATWKYLFVQECLKRNVDISRLINPDRHNHILIACMPKSGSTFLGRALMESTEYMFFFLSYGGGRNEQDLDLPRVVRSMDFDTVTQQHLRATEPNLEILNTFSINPVILVRNLFDVLVSLRDYADRRFPSGPVVYLTEEFYRMNPENQLDMLIDLAAPWYIHFYVSWYKACQKGSCEALWVTYEELIKDKPRILKRILDFYGLDLPKQKLCEAVKRSEKKFTRMNKGVSGRGREMLSEDQKERICQMTQYYPKVDFSRIGIS